MEDIADILAFEVKKEMADRYFGFRKRIEDDTAAYSERLTLCAIELENSIGTSLIRLYILLKKMDLIRGFLALTGLPADFFLDPYVLDSPTIRKKVFTGTLTRGFTARQRYFNVSYDAYRGLAAAVGEYSETLASLKEERETIRETINLFYRNNDIDSIMGFIRRLDGPDSGTMGLMQTGREVNVHCALSDTLRLQPPLPAGELLPTIAPIPPLPAVKVQLRELLHKAYRQPPTLDLKALCRSGD